MRSIGQAREWARGRGGYARPTRFARLVLRAIVGAGIAVWLVWLVASTAVDAAWYAQLGYARVLSTRLAAGSGLFALGTLLAFLVLQGNIALALRVAAAPRVPTFEQDELWAFVARVNAELARPARRLPRLARWLGRAAILLSLILGWRLSYQWDVALRLTHRVAFGVQELTFGRDVGFYVFTMPALRAALAWTTVLAAATAVAVLVLYLAAVAEEHRLDLRRPRALAAAVRLLGTPERRQLAAIVGVLALLVALAHQVTLADLPFSTRGRAGDVGFPGFVDSVIQPAALWTMTLASLAAGACVAFGVLRARRRLILWPLAAYGAVFVVGLLVPFLVQALVVAPNELDVERSYLTRFVAQTRQAYGVDAVQTEPPPRGDALDLDPQALSGVPLWSRLAMRSSLDQLQAGRPVYTFPGVDFDRYQVDGQSRLVTLAVREMSWASLPSRSWTTTHLQYTHGYGVVAATASGVSADGEPEWLTPERTGSDLILDRPEVYFGEAQAPYAIVHSAEGELELAMGDQASARPYAGQGVPIGTPLARLGFAVAMGDPSVMFTRAITPASQILYHRQVQDRLARVAPFLTFDPDAQPVVADGRLYWVVDGLSTTSDYPSSLRLDAGLAGQRTGYARASVRAVVDAYDGTTSLFVVDPDDAVVRAYQGVYPGLLQPLSRMPGSLRAHLRYPRSLFNLQAAVLARFHATDPAAFFDGRDAWRTVDEKFESRIDGGPYDLSIPWPNDPRPSSQLVQAYSPFDPTGQRQNLTALLVGGLDADGRPRLALQTYPVTPPVPGPLQVDRRIDQDPDIASQLGLFQRAGTPVLRGQLLTLPLGSTPLYVEAVYLQRGIRPIMPQLQRVIASDGSAVVMEPTLAAAVQRVRALRGSSARPEGVDHAPASSP